MEQTTLNSPTLQTIGVKSRTTCMPISFVTCYEHVPRALIGVPRIELYHGSTVALYYHDFWTLHRFANTPGAWLKRHSRFSPRRAPISINQPCRLVFVSEASAHCILVCTVWRANLSIILYPFCCRTAAAGRQLCDRTSSISVQSIPEL